MDEKFDLESIDKTFTKFKVGAKVKCKVISVMKDGVLLNIGGKKDGLIPFSDEEAKALENIKINDEFEGIITNTKDESGAVILSKSKADYVKWGNEIVNGLKVGDETNLIITKSQKGGLASNIGNFEVFIPFSQVSNRRVENLENYVNKQVKAVVLEIDLISQRIIASIRAYEENEKINTETAFWQAIFENKIVQGKAVRFTDFGAFVSVKGVDCLLHNSEASFDRTKKASDILELDQVYTFKVIKCDRETKRVSLSFKALQENPVSQKIKKLKVGDIVNGQVQKILPFGAIIKFGDNLEGLLHVKEASHFYVKNIYEVAKVGQELDLKVIGIDLEKNKVSLSLKAMQEEPEIVKLSTTKKQPEKE